MFVIIIHYYNNADKAFVCVWAGNDIIRMTNNLEGKKEEAREKETTTPLVTIQSTI